MYLILIYTKYRFDRLVFGIFSSFTLYHDRRYSWLREGIPQSTQMDRWTESVGVRLLQNMQILWWWMKHSSKFPHLNLFILLSIIITSTFPLIDGYFEVSISFGVGVGGDSGYSSSGFNSVARQPMKQVKKEGRERNFVNWKLLSIVPPFYWQLKALEMH